MAVYKMRNIDVDPVVVVDEDEEIIAYFDGIALRGKDLGEMSRIARQYWKER